MNRLREDEESDVFPEDFYSGPHQRDTFQGLIKYKNAWFYKSLFPSRYKFEQVEKFTLNKEDVLVTSFPKSGTTWVQEIIWHILNETPHNNSVDILSHRFPLLEGLTPGTDAIERRPSPRLMKSHLPYHCLPADVSAGVNKVIYIARNVKDVVVSYYHFSRMLKLINYRGTLANFFDDFVAGKVSWGPYVEHVSEFWLHRHDANLLFLTYEELHQNHKEVVNDIAKFLGRSLTEERLSAIVRLTTFEAMKKNPTVNYSWWTWESEDEKDEAPFMRKGVVGDWKNNLTAEMDKYLEEHFVEPLRKQGLLFIAGCESS